MIPIWRTPIRRKVELLWIGLILTAIILLINLSVNNLSFFERNLVSKSYKLKTRLNKISQDPALIEYFGVLTSKDVAADHPELVFLARQMMDTPSDSFTLKLSRVIYKTPQAEAIDNYLDNKTDGFYIEAGANDGERSSNTLYFEAYRGWEGLLIEPDPFHYIQLLGKNRNAWSINACLSPSKKASMLSFKGHMNGQGKILTNQSDSKYDFKVPCFPIETLLLALNVSHIDFFSLDVEGMELPIIKTIDFEKFKIDTFSVEYMHGKPNEYTSFMWERGYRLYSNIDVNDKSNFLYARDFIFIKNLG